MTPHDGLVIDRFVFDTALSIVWGGGGFALFAPQQVRTGLLSAMRTPLATCGLVAFSAGVAALPLQAASIGSNWKSAVDWHLLSAVALETHTGRSLALSAAALGAALAAATAFDRPRTSVFLSFLALGGTVTRGHAAALSGAESWIHFAIYAVHVLSATAWFGALVPFFLLLRISASQEGRAGAVAAMQCFSRLGHVAVALVLTSGAANAALILGRIPLDLSSPYQWKLAWKVAAAVAMTSLALANRYLFVPMLGAHPKTSGRLLFMGTGAEVALGLSAFALVASFGLDDPTT